MQAEACIKIHTAGYSNGTLLLSVLEGQWNESYVGETITTFCNIIKIGDKLFPRRCPKS